MVDTPGFRHLVTQDKPQRAEGTKEDFAFKTFIWYHILDGDKRYVFGHFYWSFKLDLVKDPAGFGAKVRQPLHVGWSKWRKAGTKGARTPEGLYIDAVTDPSAGGNEIYVPNQ